MATVLFMQPLMFNSKERRKKIDLFHSQKLEGKETKIKSKLATVSVSPNENFTQIKNFILCHNIHVLTVNILNNLKSFYSNIYLAQSRPGSKGNKEMTPYIRKLDFIRLKVNLQASRITNNKSFIVQLQCNHYY